MFRRSAVPAANRKVHFEPLEPRVLLSADLMPIGGDATQEDGSLARHLDGLTETPVLIDSFDSAGPAEHAGRQPDGTTGAGPQRDNRFALALDTPFSLPADTSISVGVQADRLAIGSGLPDQVGAPVADVAVPSDARQIVFVDPGVTDYERLLGELRLTAANTEIVILDAERDGVRQITEVLDGDSGIAAVHILSHGGGGSLALGNSELGADTLEGHADELAAWGAALSDDADILLYGCNVASGDWGIGFVADLAALTGADIAASDDLTGAAALGGDWVLERTTGPIGTPVLFTASDYQHVLGATFSGSKDGTPVPGGDLTGTLDFTDDRFDTVVLSGITGELTIKFRKDQLQVINTSGGVTSTLKLTGIQDISVDGTSTAATLVQFEKGASFDGVTIDLGALSADKTLTFTNDVNDPDATTLLSSGGETKPVSLLHFGVDDRDYLVSVGGQFATLKGFDGARLIGGRGGDVFRGSDTVDVADHVLGGKGGDVLFGELGDDTLEGGKGNDQLLGGGGTDKLLGGGGDDTLDGGAGDDVLKGDTLTVNGQEQEPSALNLVSGAGSDTLIGGAGNDTLEGGRGGDRLYGDADNDTLRGGKGDDTYFFESGWGSDTVTEESGQGKDALDFSAVAEALEFDLGAPDVAGQDPTGLFVVTDTSTPANRAEANGRIETLIGGKGINTYKVAQKFIEQYAPDGTFNRTLNVSNELVSGKPAAVLDLSGVTNDLKIVVETIGDDPDANRVTVIFDPKPLIGGALSKKMVVTNVAKITTGSGNDEIVFEKGAKLVGALDAGGGKNTLVYKGRSPVELPGKLLTGDSTTLSQPPQALRDLLTKYDATEILEQFGTISLNPEQNPTIGLRFTADQTLSIEEQFPAIGGTVGNIQVVSLTDFDDAVFGDNTDNTLEGGGGVDLLFGKDGADTLRGGAGADYLSGGGSIDLLFGDKGNDVIDGGDGTDQLEGGKGDDVLIGGAGNDLLKGQGGNDTFVFEAGWGQDIIDDGILGRGADTLDFSAIADTVDLTYSFASSKIKAGTGAFQREAALLGFDKATGSFTDPNADTVTVNSTGLLGLNDNKVRNIKTGAGNQTFYFGNQWSTTSIDRSAMAAGKNLVLDFSGSTVPLIFTFDVVTEEMANDNPAFAGKKDQTFVQIDLLSGLTDLSLNSLANPFTLADKVEVVVDAETKIISGRNANFYRTRNDAQFEGELLLLGGPQYDSFLATETAFISGFQVLHSIDFTEKFFDVETYVKNLANPLVFDAASGAAGRGVLDDAGLTPFQVLKDIGKSLLIPTSSPFGNKIDQIKGIENLVLEPGSALKPGAKIGGAIFGSGLNVMVGDPGTNVFEHKFGRIGAHLLAGGTGADTYKIREFFGWAAVLEPPDLFAGAPVPEAIDTLDLSGFVGDVDVDVYDWDVFKGDYSGFIPDFDLSEVGLVGGNVLLVNAKGLNTIVGGVPSTPFTDAVDAVFGRILALDIESLVGPALGTLTVRLHGDASLRGTLSAGALGTVTLDYSDYDGPVVVEEGKKLTDLLPFDLPDGAVADFVEIIQNRLIGSGSGGGTTLADRLGIDDLVGFLLPETTTAAATGIAGHRLGGLTTFADLFGDDNIVSETLGEFAVNGLGKVILGPAADTVSIPSVGIEIEGIGLGDLVNVPDGTLDLLSTGETGDFEVNFSTGEVTLDGSLVLSNLSVARAVSGLGDDTFTGSIADETFVFKVEEQDDGSFLGWGVDTLVSGGGADQIELSLPDGWRWGAASTAGPGSGYTILILDDNGVLTPNGILLPGSGDFTVVGADGSWPKDATTLSLDSLVTATPPAGLAIDDLPAAVLEAAIRSFDGLTLRVAKTDGSGSDDFTLAVSDAVRLDGTQSVQLIASNGAILFDSASLRRSVIVTDLPDRQLSTRLVSGEILIDATAADHGWNTDPTVAPPAGKVDLLSVVVHELGQRLRLDGAIAIMQPTIAPGADGPALPGILEQAGAAFVDAPLEVTELPGFAITGVTPDIDAIVDRAVDLWRAANLTVLGNSTATPTINRPVVEFTDLSGGELARSLPDGTVLLDPTAAGHGWFVDLTPETDDDVPADKIDLLTVLLHEIGHGLGLGHDLGAGPHLLDEVLTPGVRLAVPAGPIEVVTLESSDQSKLARGLDAFGDWVAALGDRVDQFLTTGVDIPLLGDLSLGGLFNLNGDAASEFTSELRSKIIDEVALVFAGGGPVTNLDIEALANIEFAPTSNAVAYVASVDLPGLDFSRQIGLDPSQLELGGLDPATFGIGLDSETPPLLDVVGGLDLQFIFGLDGAGDFYVEAPGVEASLSINSATPFDVGLSLGPFGLAIQQGTVDIGASTRLGTSARLGYDALVQNRLDPAQLIPTLGAGAHWDIDLPLVLTGALSGVNSDGLAIRAEGQLDGGIGSLANVISGIEFETPGLDDILDLVTIDPGLILDLAIAGLDALIEPDSVINQKLPGLNKSVADLLGDGTDDFVTGLKNSLEQLRQDGIDFGSLQDELNTAISNFIGVAVQPFSLAYDDSVLTVDLDLAFALAADATAGFGLDIDAFAAQLGLDDALEFAGLDIEITDPSVELALDAAVGLDFGFGIDLSDLLNVETFIDAASGISVDFSAGTAEPVDFAVDLALGGARVGFRIEDATAELGLGGRFGLADNADGRYAFGPGNTGGLVFETGIDGRASLDLPIFFPTLSNPLNGTTADLDGDGFGENVLHFGAELEGGQFAFETTAPDLGDLFGLSALLNDPDTVLRGLEGIFTNIKDALDGRFKDIDLPLIGDELANKAEFVDGLREKFLGKATGGIYSAGGSYLPEDPDSLGGKLEALVVSGGSVFEEIVGLIKDGLFLGLGDILKVPVTDGNGDPVFDPATGQIQFRPIASADEIQIDFTGSGITFNVLIGDSLLSEMIDFDFDASAPGLSLSSDEASVLLDIGYVFGLGFGLDAKDKVFLDTSGVTQDGEEFALDVSATIGDGAKVTAKLGFLEATLEEMFDADAATAQALADRYGVAPDTDGNSGLFAGISFDLADGGGDGRWTIGEQLVASANLFAEANVDLGATIGIPAGGSVSLPEVFTVIHYDQVFADVTFSSSGGGSASFGDPPTLTFENVTLDIGTVISDFLGPIAEELAGFIGPDTTLIQLLELLTTEIDIGVAKFSLLANEFDESGNITTIGFVESFAKTNADKEKARKAKEAIDKILEFSDFIGAIDFARGESIMVSFGDFTVGGGLLSDKPTNDGAAEPIDENEFESEPAPDLDQQTAGTNSKGVVEKLGKDRGSIQVPLIQNPANLLGLLLGRRTDLFIYDLPKLDINVGVSKSFPVFPGLNARIGGAISVTSAFNFGFDTTGIEKWSDKDFAVTPANLLLPFEGFYFGDNIDADGNDLKELTLSAGLKAGASVGVSGLVEAGVEGGVEAIVSLDLADIPIPNPDPNIQVGDGRLYFDEIGQRLLQGPQCLFELEGELRAFLEAFFWVGVDAGFFEITIFEARERFVDQILAQFDFSCPPPTLDVAHLADDGTLTIRAIDANGAQIDSAGRGGFMEMRERYGIALVNEDFDGDGSTEEFIRVVGNGTTEFFDPNAVTSIQIGGTSFDDEYVIDSSLDGSIKLEVIEVHGKGGNDVIEVGSGSATISRTIDGGAGNDTIVGSFGADTIFGGEGRDTITGGGGLDQLHGGGGDDFITGGDLADLIWGDAGNDRLQGGLGADKLYGGTGNDTLLGGDGNDELFGVTDTSFANNPNNTNARSRDLLSGGLGDDVIRGGDGDDTLIGGLSSVLGDTLEGGDGGDSFLWRAGDGVDRIYGSDAQSDPTANTFDDKVSLSAVRPDQQGLPSDPGTDDLVALSASGADVIADWNGVALQLSGLHSIDLDTGDGADRVTVDDLRDTTLAFDFPLLAADGTPVLLGNLNIALGSSRAIVQEERQSLDANGNPEVDEEGKAVKEVFDIVSKSDDLDADILEIRGEGGVDEFTLTRFADFDPENSNAIQRLKVEQAQGLTIQVQEIGFSQDRIDIDAGSGDDRIDASGLDLDLVDDLRLLGGDGDDRLIGTEFSETIIGGLGADRITGDAGVDVFISADHPEPAREEIAGVPVVDTLIEMRDADFMLSDDAIAIGAEQEILDGYFEAVELTGGESSNRFTLNAFTGSGFLDGGEGGDNYEITVAQSGTGTTFLNIDDSGLTGIDELLYLGSTGDDVIQLDTVYVAAEDPAQEFAFDRWAAYGDFGDGLMIVRFTGDADAFQRADLDNEDALTGLSEASLGQAGSFQVVNYASVEENRVFAGEGNDKIISDDTSQNMSVYGNAGDDEFYVGSILETETVLVEGREVTVVTSFTRGASFQMNFYGGADDDYFQINHNAADIALFGDNGDDTFFVRALLTLDENEDVVEVENKLARVSGVTGEGSEESQRNDDTRAVDIDALVYVENANIAIDGGAGFDSVAIVGTVLSDTFYVFTEVEDGEVVQRIFGAGVKLRELLNIERLQLITGAGDDRVFVYGVDLGPVADLVISTGTGSDTVEFGGPERTIDLTFPRKSRTEYASVDGFEPGAELEVNFGLDIGLIDNPSRVVPFVVEEPAQTRSRTITSARSIAGVRSPVIVRDVDGLVDTVVFNNQDGPTDVVFENRELLRKAIETESSLVVYPTTPRPGDTTDLIAELGALGAGADQVVATVNDYLENLVLFTDRYFDTELIGRLQALQGAETETVTISAGVSYAVFQDTLDDTGQFVTARDQLTEFLDGTGFQAEFSTTPNPDPSQTVPLFDIVSITKIGDPSQSLAFEAQYREFVLDDVVLRDLIGISLVTAGPVDVEIEAGWVTSASVADVDVFDSVYSAGEQPTIFFGGQEELVINLAESGASTLLLNNELFDGKVSAFGGTADDVFDVRTVAGQTFLNGGEGDDDFLILEGFVGNIDANLFLRGDGGVDDVIVHAGDFDAGVDVLFDKNTVQQTQTFERLSRVTNALEFTNLTDTENQLIQESLQADAVPFAKLAAMVDAQDLLLVVTRSAQATGLEIIAALEAVKVDFAAEVEDLVVEQRGIFEEFLTGVIQEYVNARKQIDAAQSDITRLERQIGGANDLIDFLQSLFVFRNVNLDDLVLNGGSLGFLELFPKLADNVRTLFKLRADLRAAQERLEEGKLRRAGAEGLLAPGGQNDAYVTAAELNSNYGALKSDFPTTAGALIANSGKAQIELDGIENDVRAAGAATLGAIQAVIDAAEKIDEAEDFLQPDVDPRAAINDVLQALTVLKSQLEAPEDDPNKRFVRVERLALVKDVTLAEQRERLEEALALFDAIPDPNGTAYDTGAFLDDANWLSALTLFDTESFQDVLAAYDQARDIARDFVDFRSSDFANLRSVTLNADKFAVFKRQLETTFNFDAFKQAYLANVEEVLGSLGLFADLAVESKLLAQLASLEQDQEKVDAVVARNEAVTSVFEQLRDDADVNFTEVKNLLTDIYTISFTFWRYTVSATLDFSKDFRFVNGSAELELRQADLDDAVAKSQPALADKSAVDAQVTALRTELFDLQAGIAAERDRLDALNEELTAQFRFLRSLSATAVAVLAQTRAETAAAEFSDTSSLISEILSYDNMFEVTDEPGVTSLLDIFLPGPTGNSVIERVERSDFFEVLTLTGLNAGGIHADYDTVENFTLITGDGADNVRVHDSLGQKASNVFIQTGIGDDDFVVSNPAGSVDDIAGNVLIDAGAGANKLLIDDRGDLTGDEIVQQYGRGYTQIVGMADGDIFYRATGGDFSQGLEIFTSSGDDRMTLRALYGTDHTELHTGVGADTVIVDDFVVDPLATLTIYTETEDDTVQGDLAPLGFTAFGAEGNDLLHGGAFADLLIGDGGQNVLIGGAGTDTLTGGDEDDIIIGDRGRVDYFDESGDIVAGLGTGITPVPFAGPLSVVRRAALISTLDAEFGAGDNIVGAAGNDTILGGAGSDSITGDTGDDLILGDHGAIELTPSGGFGPVTPTLPRLVRTFAEDSDRGDEISGREGRDIVLGGGGGDLIDVLGADVAGDIILGDHGEAEFNESGTLIRVESTDTKIGGNDEIYGGVGPNTIIGGAGDDSILAGGDDSPDVVLGDSGQALFNDEGVAREVRTTAANDGGNDTIIAGDGPNILFGGSEDDTIFGGSREDIVLGDNGEAFFSDDGVLVVIRSTDPGTGGNDLIEGRAGRDIVLGGGDDDVIDASGGTAAVGDVILGDDGEAVFNDLGILVQIESTNSEFGGNDDIVGGIGPNTIFGGARNDTIFAGGDDSPDVVLGDSGLAIFNQEGVALEIRSTAPGDGGDDLIEAGDGPNILFGGSENDTILGGSVEDVILGDNGQALFTGFGVLFSLATTDPEFGGNDFIESGDGVDIVAGGSKDDIVLAGGSDLLRDIVLGDNGLAEFTFSGVLTGIRSTDPLFGGNDIITAGGGPDVVIGGSDNDVLLAATAGEIGDVDAVLALIGAGDFAAIDPGDDAADIVLGDNGVANFSGAAALLDIRTSDPASGGRDTIVGGNGPDVIFGGGDDDIVVAGGTDDARDIVLGDDGQATFAGTGAFDPGEETAILSFNFNASSDSRTVTGTAGAGDARAANWNNLAGDGPQTFGDADDESVLFDDGRIAAGVTIRWGEDLDTAPGDLSTDSHSQITPGDDQDLRLFEGYLETSTSHTIGVDIAGLSSHFRTYDLYVYLDADDFHSKAGRSVRAISDGATTFYLDDADGNTFTGTYVQVDSTDPTAPETGNYVVFTGLSTDVATIRIDDDGTLLDSTLNRPAITAVQVVGQSHPIDRIESIDPTFGGDDIILTGGGRDIAIGGSGDDIIDTFGPSGRGIADADVVAGDSARATFMLDQLREISTSFADTGGDDAINTGAGEDIVLGGDGDDVIVTGTDQAPDLGNVQVLSVNFNSGVDKGVVTGVAGAVQAGNWNNIPTPNSDDDDDRGPSQVVGGLMFNDGSEAGGVTVEVGRNLDAHPSAADPDSHSQIDNPGTQNERLFEGYLHNSTSRTLGVDLNGLAAQFGGGPYDVYVYLDADDGRSRSGTSVRRISDGTTAYYLNDADGNTFAGQFVEIDSTDPNAPETGNFVVFRNLTGDAVSIRIDDDGTLLASSLNRPAITAIQVVGGPDKNAVLGTEGDAIGGDFDTDAVVGDNGVARLFGGALYELVASEPAASGNDTIATGEGSDFVIGGSGGDLIDGQAGHDILLGDAARLIFFDGEIAGLEFDSGDDDDDDDPGFDPFDVLGIQLLNDDIGGDDTLTGGTGDDLMYGQFGDDTFAFAGGGLGEDRVVEAGNGGGRPNDLHDRLDFTDFIGPVDVDLGRSGMRTINGGRLDGDVNLRLQLFSGTAIEDVTGSAFADEIEGNSRNNRLLGLAGNDELRGESGDDLLLGGAGDDDIYGGSGDDLLDGGDGNDDLFGESGDDLLLGGSGDDYLNGGSGDDLIDGEDGNDTIRGQSDDDLLLGGAGNDHIRGDSGADVLEGGDGVDNLSGGSGPDSVEYGTGTGPLGLLGVFQQFELVFGLDGFEFADPTSGDPNADDRPPRLWIEDYLESVPGNEPMPPMPPPAASAATAAASGAALAAMSASRGSRAAMLTRVFHEELNAFVEIDDMKQLQGMDGGLAAAGMPGGDDDLLLVDGAADGGGSADTQGPAVNWEGDFTGFAPSP